VGGNFSILAEWLRRRAENVLAIMLAALFLAFIVQIVFRYLLNFPIGWTHELSIVAWIWLVLWGAAFVVREDEEIRFDLVYGSVRASTRRLMVVFAALSLVALYAVSLPSIVDYVIFMKVQETAYLDIRFDFLFSIYVVFAVAAIVRYCWLAWRAIWGPPPEAPDITKAGSGV
jgi:TRAP-type C4-dicarboxylate transport system permease small subunit